MNDYNNYGEEFDLMDIYAKLTSSSTQGYVKACDFFDDGLFQKLSAVLKKECVTQ